MSWSFSVVVAAIVAVCAVQCSASPHPGLKVAMCQIPAEDGDLKGNMKLAEDAILTSLKHKPDLICLPEAVDWGWLWQDARKDALPIPGPYTDMLTRLAKEHKVWISAGCLEKDGDKTYNSAVIINRDGEIVLKHRKIKTLPAITKHLYDQGKIEDIKVIDTEFGRIGMTICADNFTSKIPQKVGDLGAWLLITPHGFAADESELEGNGRSFQKHIRTVAREARLWVIGTDTVLGRIKGGAWKGKLHSGCSTIACPHGLAAVVGKFKEPDMIICEIPAEP